MKENQTTKLAVMAERINNIDKTVEEINTKLDKNYVTTDKLNLYSDRLNRVEKLVYGVVALIGSAVVLAVIRLVVVK